MADFKRRRAVLAAATALLIGVPLAVGAVHRFADVPASHTFHEDVRWLADAGVTRGCNPPANDRFCPDELVNRGQMAAFLRRLSANRVVDAGRLGGRPPVAYRTVVAGGSCDQVTASACPLSGTLFSVDLRAPSAGVVKLDYAMSLESANRGDSVVHAWVNDDQTCNWRLVPLDALRGSFSVSYFPDLEEPDFHAVAGTTTVSVPPATTVFSLCAMAIDVEVAYASLTALWSPGGGGIAVASPGQYMEFPDGFGAEFSGMDVPGFDD